MCADWDGPDVKRAQSREVDETWVIICEVKGSWRMDRDLISQLVKMWHGDVIHPSSITVRSGADRSGFTQRVINLSSRFPFVTKTSSIYTSKAPLPSTLYLWICRHTPYVWMLKKCPIDVWDHLITSSLNYSQIFLSHIWAIRLL